MLSRNLLGIYMTGKCCDEFDFYFLALFCMCKY